MLPKCKNDINPNNTANFFYWNDKLSVCYNIKKQTASIWKKEFTHNNVTQKYQYQNDNRSTEII